MDLPPVEPPDAAAAARALGRARCGPAGDLGALAPIAAWLGGTGAAGGPATWLCASAGSPLPEPYLPLHPVTGSAAAGIAAGRAAADRAVDAGARLIVAAGDEASADAAAGLVALLTGVEVVKVADPGVLDARGRLDDAAWLARVRLAREIGLRGAGLEDNPVGLLTASERPELAALTGLLLGAVLRRTAVLLDGLAAVTAALLVERLAPGARAWWALSCPSADPALQAVLPRIRVPAVLDLQARPRIGVGPRLALAVLAAGGLFWGELPEVPVADAPGEPAPVADEPGGPAPVADEPGEPAPAGAEPG